MEQKLLLLQEATIVASLATESVVFYDDMVDKINGSTELRERLLLTPRDIEAGEKVLRRIQNHAHDVRADLHQELMAELNARKQPARALQRRSTDTADPEGAALAVSAQPEQLPLSPQMGPAQEQRTLDCKGSVAYSDLGSSQSETFRP